MTTLSFGMIIACYTVAQNESLIGGRTLEKRNILATTQKGVQRDKLRTTEMRFINQKSG